jgi:TRAP-type C4-dicarboxylate transport system permease small subunit
MMRWLSRVSNAILIAEQWLISVLAAALVVLILLNIVTRAAGAAIFWVDELAIYTMIWMAMVGASVMLRLRIGVAVTLFTDLLPPRISRAVHRLVDAALLFFAATLLVLCWQWYDPVALFRAGFDFELFAQETFKFIYTDPTNTIGIPKFWVWLAVPGMALSMTLHALTNLLEGPPEPASGDASQPRVSGKFQG